MKKPKSEASAKPAAKAAPAAKGVQSAKNGQVAKEKAATAKAAAVAKVEKIELVTLRQLSSAVAETKGLSAKQTNEILTETISMIGQHLKKRARIRIAGLGTLEVRERKERQGRNPATGEPIKIKASRKVAFRAAKDLQEAI